MPPAGRCKMGPPHQINAFPGGGRCLGAPTTHARTRPVASPTPPRPGGLPQAPRQTEGVHTHPTHSALGGPLGGGGSAAGGECVLLAAPPFDFPSQRTCVLRGGQGALARSVRYTASPDNWGGSWTAARGGEGTPPAGQGLPLFYWHTRRPRGRRGRGLCPAPALSPVSAQPLPSTQASPTSHRPRARLTDGWPTMTEVRQGWRRGDGGRGGERTAHAAGGPRARGGTRPSPPPPTPPPGARAQPDCSISTPHPSLLRPLSLLPALRRGRHHPHRPGRRRPGKHAGHAAAVRARRRR